MKKNKIQICLLIDKSGSMASIQDDAIQMVRNYIKDQKSLPKDVYLSIYNFSTKLETHVENIPIKEYNEDNYILVPNGWTALLDAMGESIDKTGIYLDSISESDRPEKVFFITITDGYENFSKKFKASDIKNKIKHQEEKYNWTFLFLGANIDSISEGRKIGASYGNTLNWTASIKGSQKMSETLSAYTLRACSNVGYFTAFTDSERHENASL